MTHEVHPVVEALAVWNNKLIAAGQFRTAGDSVAKNIAVWNDTLWRPLSSQNAAQRPVGVLTVFQGRLIVGCSYIFFDDENADRIAAYDGQTWAKLGSGLSDNPLAFAVYNDKLITGGLFVEAGGDTVNYIAEWSYK